MKDALIGIGIGLVVVIVGYGLVYPYYCLAYIKDIAEELEKIRKVIEDKKVTK